MSLALRPPAVQHEPRAYACRHTLAFLFLSWSRFESIPRSDGKPAPHTPGDPEAGMRPGLFYSSVHGALVGLVNRWRISAPDASSSASLSTS